MKKLSFFFTLLSLPFVMSSQVNLTFDNIGLLCANDSPLEFTEDTLPDGSLTRLYRLYTAGKYRFPDSTIVVWNFNTRFPFPHGSDSSFFNLTDFVIDGHHPVVMKQTGVFDFKHINLQSLPERIITASPVPSKNESSVIETLNLNDHQNLSKRCIFNGKKIYGRVRVVEYDADFKVKLVERDEFLSIKLVTTESPNECGFWKMVDSSEDFSVQFVEYGEDFSIRFRKF